MSALANILAYASGHVPRYRGLPSVLGSFPVLNKAAVRANQAAYLSDELGTGKSALASFLADEERPCGHNEETKFGSHLVVEQTSGSSGIPFRTVKTLEERARLSFAIWNGRRQLDARCSVKNFYPIYHRPPDAVTIGNSRDFTTEGVSNLYRSLTAAGMRWVHCSADILRRHAELISREVAQAKSVCFAENTSVTLREEDARFIEDNLQVALSDQYGCRETWAIGIGRRGGQFDVLSENVVVELLDDDNRPITELGHQGRIVVTGLHQRIFPILRYDTGDLGCWAANPPGRRLRLTNYRQHNILRFQRREVDGNELFRKMLGRANREVGYAPWRYLQIRQIGPARFQLAVNTSPKARPLCEALRRVCAADDHFHPGIAFELHELAEIGLELEMRNKPSLFTTKHLQFVEKAPP